MHPFRIAGLWLALAFVTVAGGCDEYCYEIVLTPDGDALRRELTCWKQSGQSETIKTFPQDRLQRIASVYSAATPEKLDQKHAFSGRFVGKMPGDVGGYGTYTRWETELGTAATYMERFGGSDDLAGQIDSRRKAVNRIVDLIIGWFETELSQEASWKDLRHFLDAEFRRDVDNLSCLLLAARAAEDFEADSAQSTNNRASERAWITRFMRVGQYLIEHGYVEPRDAPALFGVDDGRALVALLKKQVTRRIGFADDSPRPKALAFLASAEALQTSLDRYLRTTPEFAALERAWREKKRDKPDEAAPEPTAALYDLIGQAFFKISFSDATHLKIVLAGGEMPAATNGIWNKETRQVSWQTTQNDAEGLPTFVFAMWSVPAPTAQDQRFGKLALAGENLVSYVMWYHGLTKAERSEWDEFLASLGPGPELRRTIDEFRFTTDPPSPADQSAGPVSSRADEPRKLILEGLKESQAR